MEAGWLFGSEELSDAQLVLVEEEAQEEGDAPCCARYGNGGDAAAASNDQGEPARKRARLSGSSSIADGAAKGLVLPIHRAIVMSASEFFKARLSTWKGGGGEPCRVLLHVPAGQLELGRRLVRAMYEAEPSLSDLSTEQRMQLLQLADRNGAPNVVEAAAAGINAAAIADKGLAWATVQAAFPPHDSPAAIPALQKLARNALQQLFGDLEAVWASAGAAEKRRQLLELPYTALKALLSDERTRVASENTVMHTINEWVAHKKVPPKDARVKQLHDLVRVARLTPHYARTVFCESDLANEHLSIDKVVLAAMLPLMDDAAECEIDKDSHDDGDDDDDDFVANWRLPARPRSALAGALELDWSLPLSKLGACVTALPAEGEGRSDVLGPAVVAWQGWPLQLGMDCNRSASGGLSLGLYLQVKPPVVRAAAVVTRDFKVVGTSRISGTTIGPSTCLYSYWSPSWGTGLKDALRAWGTAGADNGGEAPPKDWAGVEAALRAARLVHGGGDGGEEAHLKLRCTVTKLE